ncbi:hypothetical protein GFC01_05875 [Desulfofundulus thermobenzoicus]|uniref:Helicase ATP-binding domain-containing protein n=1 Tax=Desulfofundulus thermobenzoicus TaxID=29376 RepID=A0A6N7IQI8_9FIRM|nr:ATP-dependent DNA helicase [Desulfofundulus thermobenzoicus]MQL51797.1 hypothetical protein [Desulfofundulus thermobenzoicus]
MSGILAGLKDTVPVRDLPAAAEEIMAGAPGLTPRPGQLRMAKAVARLLAGEWPALAVEAGTGTGKSLAYLVPAMLWTVREGKRVIVATRTKNLQTQLAEKDAPLAAGLVSEYLSRPKPSVAVLKGKGNYLCPVVLELELKEALKKDRRARYAWRRGGAKKGNCPPLSPKTVFLAALKFWAAIGGSGQLDDLPAWPGIAAGQKERETWFYSVSAAADDAACVRCKVDCPFARAKKEAARAEVVITNHAVVAVDWMLRIKAGISLFHGKEEAPPGVLILDEAHNFPDSFRGTLEVSFSRHRWTRLRDDLKNFVNEATERIYNASSGVEKAEFAEKNGRDMAAFAFLAARADRRVDALFAKRSAGSERAAGEGDSRRAAIFPEDVGEAEECAAVALEEFLFAAESVMSRYLARLAGSDVNLARKAERLFDRMDAAREAVERAVLLLGHYREGGNDACWFEKSSFRAAPVKLQEYFPDLWRLYPGGTVFTSATLFPFPQSEGFRWFLREFALPGGAACGAVESPFDYDRQLSLYIPTDDCLQPKSGDKPRKLAELVARVANFTPGGVLVLCTSFKEMRAVANFLATEYATGRTLLVQGDAGKAELVRRFSIDGRAILIGVDSFWEGVDFPGDMLTAVVISKLPFPVPDDPIIEALTYMAGGGWPAFQKISLPICATRLRQGVGRLIRRETDTGMVIIADPRLPRKYEKLFAVLPAEPQVGLIFGRREKKTG